MSYTNPVTHIDKVSPYRAYVLFYYNGERQRIYNGKAIGIRCFPNQQASLTDKRRELVRLQLALVDALKGGWHPGKPQVPIIKPREAVTAVEQLQLLSKKLDNRGWSKPYLRDMTRIISELRVHLLKHNPALLLCEIDSTLLNTLLDNYRSSGRYYMNKRRNLSALFKLLASEENLPTNPVKATLTMKTVEMLNEAFTPEQLIGVLAHLEAHHPNLYLCALMTYGTLLRPHREIRLLQRMDFDATLDCITLTGKATKSGRIRRVAVPDFVKERLLQRRVDKMQPDAFIFTGTTTPLNPDYFTTAWSRQKALMFPLGLIQPNQTLYSFRHSAAHYSFNDRQNLKLLQSLMGHSTPDVTMKYLRSLGVIEVSHDDMPRLPGER